MQKLAPIYYRFLATCWNLLSIHGDLNNQKNLVTWPSATFSKTLFVSRPLVWVGESGADSKSIGEPVRVSLALEEKKAYIIQAEWPPPRQIWHNL